VKIQIDTEKFNLALHDITRAINALQVIRDEFLESIDIEEIQGEEKKNENNA